MNLYDFDQEIREQKQVCLLCGVDEAGRGPLAGPVSAAAVILDPAKPIEGLNDSKKLTQKKREKLFLEIEEKAITYYVVCLDNLVVDEINILNAAMKAMALAVDGLSTAPELVLIDGNKVPDELATEGVSVVKGDAKSASIAAASIVAKVTRDKLMEKYDEEYPEFLFSKHKGYPTKLHYEKIIEFGVTPIHRRTFLKKLGELKMYAKTK